MAYSKPLLEAVPTKSGAAVRIKRQQLKAETQGQNANQDTKEKNTGGKYDIILCFSSEFQRFQMKCSHHACLSNEIVMKIQQPILLSSPKQTCYSRAVAKQFCVILALPRKDDSSPKDLLAPFCDCRSQRNYLPSTLSNVRKTYFHFSLPDRAKRALMSLEIKD